MLLDLNGLIRSPPQSPPAGRKGAIRRESGGDGTAAQFAQAVSEEGGRPRDAAPSSVVSDDPPPGVGGGVSTPPDGRIRPAVVQDATGSGGDGGNGPGPAMIAAQVSESLPDVPKGGMASVSHDVGPHPVESSGPAPPGAMPAIPVRRPMVARIEGPPSDGVAGPMHDLPVHGSALHAMTDGSEPGGQVRGSTSRISIIASDAAAFRDVATGVRNEAALEPAPGIPSGLAGRVNRDRSGQPASGVQVAARHLGPLPGPVATGITSPVRTGDEALIAGASPRDSESGQPTFSGRSSAETTAMLARAAGRPGASVAPGARIIAHETSAPPDLPETARIDLPPAPVGRGEVVMQLPSVAQRGQAPAGLGQTGSTGEPAALPLPAASPAPAGNPAPVLYSTAPVERTVVQQIASAIPHGAPAGRIEITLDPPELGRVEIAIDVAEQSLRATLSAERPVTGDLIRRHLDMLNAQFREAGFSDVDLSYAGHQGDRPDRQTPAGAAVVSQPETPVDVQTRRPAAAMAGSTRIDIRL